MVLQPAAEEVFFTSNNGITAYRDYFRKIVEEGFNVGFEAYVDIVENNKPAKYQEKALIDFFNKKTDEMLNMVQATSGKKEALSLKEKLFSDIPGIAKGLARMKPYTGTHNSGYTECQEFYGAITIRVRRTSGETGGYYAGCCIERSRQ